MTTTAQIGKAGELLVQYMLLLRGIESAPMTTDSGIDLVAFSQRQQKAITMQVKTNLKPKPGGGKGRAALDWWIPDTSPADLIALVDASKDRVWIFSMDEIRRLSQQHPEGRHHLYMTVDPTSRPSKLDRPVFDHEFESFRLENLVHRLF